jgi:ribosomal protein S24E
LSFEVVEEHTNNLLGRREAKLVVHHEGAGTPDRLTVRKLASEHFKTPVDRVFVRSIATRTGGSSATCMVEIYNDAKAADIVPAYLKNRMLPKDQRVAKKKTEEEPKPAAPAAKAPKPAAEKKAEAKPAEKKEEAKAAPARETRAPAGKEAKPAGKEEKPAAKEAKPAKAESKPKA